MYPLPEWKKIFLTRIQTQNLNELICEFPIELREIDYKDQCISFVPSIYTHEFNLKIHGAQFNLLFNPTFFIETDINLFLHYMNDIKYDWKQELTQLLSKYQIQIVYLPNLKRFKILNFCLFSKHGPFFKLKIDLNWNDMRHIENSVMFKTKIVCHNILKLKNKKKKKKKQTKSLASYYFLK